MPRRGASETLETGNHPEEPVQPTMKYDYMRTIRLGLSGEARMTAAALCSWDISVWRGRVPFLEGEGCGVGPTRDRRCRPYAVGGIGWR